MLKPKGMLSFPNAFTQIKQKRYMDIEILKSKTVLFVEDEDLLRDAIAKFLGRRCKEVYVASNGKEGLKAYKKHKPDLVITDIEMPRMNGIELIDEIEKLDPDNPTIIVSAYNDDAHNDSRAYSRIIKPIENRYLLQLMIDAICKK